MQTLVDHPEYNATAIDLRRVHEDLLILRVEPDDSVPKYEPGQYTTLGLLSDEPGLGEHRRAENSDHRVIRRAYSISSPIVDDSGVLCDSMHESFLEFYIALVRKDSATPPSLTPRIFAMGVGHRLYMGPRPKGTYTLAPVQPTDNVIFVATGTGEAPHNAMLRELLVRRHEGQIASFVCVRHKRDLAYLQTHQALAESFKNYRYLPLTTREPKNLDRSHPQFVGKQYLQDIFSADDLQRLLGWTLQSRNTHVFLCGNPAMIGAPKRVHDDHGHDEHVAFPDPKGMIETLVERGFRLERRHDTGNIHFERYW